MVCEQPLDFVVAFCVAFWPNHHHAQTLLTRTTLFFFPISTHTTPSYQSLIDSIPYYISPQIIHHPHKKPRKTPSQAYPTSPLRSIPAPSKPLHHSITTYPPHNPHPQMLFDKRLVHIAENLILVPYLPRHVPKYHGWMSNELILQQTASEALSLEEEFEMQITWATDEDKRTCILIPRRELHELLQKLPIQPDTNPIEYMDGDDTLSMKHIVDRCANQTIGKCSFCHKDGQVVTTLLRMADMTPLSSPLTPYLGVAGIDVNSIPTTIPEASAVAPIAEDAIITPTPTTTTTETLTINTTTTPQRQCCLMCEANAACGDFGVDVAIGDVNLFLHDYLQDEQDDEEEDAANQCVGLDDDDVDKKPTVAEVEIMIAEVSARRRGFGEVAVKLLTQYAVEYLQIQRFIAKINSDNHPSQSLFTRKLGYVVYATVECFDEIHLDWKVARANDYPWYPSRNLPPDYVPNFWKN